MYVCELYNVVTVSWAYAEVKPLVGIKILAFMKFTRWEKRRARHCASLGASSAPPGWSPNSSRTDLKTPMQKTSNLSARSSFVQVRLRIWKWDHREKWKTIRLQKWKSRDRTPPKRLAYFSESDEWNPLLSREMQNLCQARSRASFRLGS